MFAIGAAWAALSALVSFVFAINNDIIILKSDLKYNASIADNCVQNDIYQVEKLLMLEKLGKK